MAIAINGSGTITGISAGGLPDGCIVTADLDSTVPVAKAWVNFNGTASSNLTGTYSISGTTTLTVTATSHGFSVGQAANLNFTTGSGTVNGTYTVVTVPDANTFTITHGTAVTTSGNVTINRNTIRASYNVSSITDNGTGDYTVNFTSALADANYAATFGSAQESATVGGAACINDASVPTASALRIRSYSIGSSSNLAADKAYVHVSVFR